MGTWITTILIGITMIVPLMSLMNREVIMIGIGIMNWENGVRHNELG